MSFTKVSQSNKHKQTKKKKGKNVKINFDWLAVYITVTQLMHLQQFLSKTPAVTFIKICQQITFWY
jgi:hypothetical protein